MNEVNEIPQKKGKVTNKSSINQQTGGKERKRKQHRQTVKRNSTKKKNDTPDKLKTWPLRHDQADYTNVSSC